MTGGETDLERRVAGTGMFGAGDPVVVLLSGGRDSVCLLDIAVTLASAGAVIALHVNYGLRGEHSDADEAACRGLCDRLSVPLEVERRRRPPGAGNLHAWARDARYAAGAIASERHGAWLAAGHTVTDQLETILYRLASSPGRRALTGMPVRSGRLVRPLLAAAATRAETASWCLSRGLPWREDPSNDDPSFARARVRGGLVPAFLAVDPRAEQNILRTAELLAGEAAVLDGLVSDVLGGEPLSIARSRLAGLPEPLGRLVLRRMAETATGTLCARAATRLADVLALDHGALDLGDGARAIVEGGTVTLARTPPLGAAR